MEKSFFLEAVNLLLQGDREVYFIALTSISFSLISTLLASVIGVPCGILLFLSPGRGKRAINSILSSLMALPTVVVGLLVYTLISRSGPLGFLGLLYTPTAVVVGQMLLILPILISMAYTGIAKLDKRFFETLKTLGAAKSNILSMTLWEARIPLLGTVLAGFGRALGEVGVSMMLGGNIRWYTRTMTTTIALETSKGEFVRAVALGIILIVLSLLINSALHFLVKGDKG